MPREMSQPITVTRSEGVVLASFDTSRTATISNGLPISSGINKEMKYIKSYSYIPNQFLFHKVNSEEELFMGVELEVDGGEGESDEIAGQCINMIGENNIYCKHDGSLQSGFEIVTHPCTFDYHKNLSYENLFDFLVNKKYKSHDTTTCGLHVHFNKSYFGKDKIRQDLNIGKFLYIMEKFWDKVVLVARRDSNRFSRRFNISEDETILDLYAKSKNSDKYGAVNMQHKDTFEIRIFKGTLNYKTFISTLEFVDKLVKYIKQIDIYDIQMITWNDIESNFSSELNEYINEREEKEKNNPKKKEVINNGCLGALPSGSWTMSCDFAREYQTQWTTAAQALSSLNEAVFQAEESDEQIIKRKIKNLRRDERRENNYMAKLNIRREIAKLEIDLHNLRINNRRNTN